MYNFFYNNDRRGKLKSYLWRTPLIAVLEKDVFKNPWKITLWEFIVHFLVKSSRVFFKNFAYVLINLLLIRKFQEHLITGTSFNGSFCIYIFQWLLQRETNPIESIVEIKGIPIEHEIILFSFRLLNFNILQITTYRGNS